MKKLKKLTRKGLDELAKEMPEMKVAEQSECVGAYRYYWNNGDGSKESSIWDGGSEEIRVTNSNGMGYASCGVEPLTQDILPLTNNNTNMKILFNQVLSKVEDHGLGSGVIIREGTDPFNVIVDTNFFNPIIEILMPCDINAQMFQYDIDNALEGLNDYFDSGLILRQQGLI